VRLDLRGLVVGCSLPARRRCPYSPPFAVAGNDVGEDLVCDAREILADPADPEHDERREWIGSPFDDEA